MKEGTTAPVRPASATNHEQHDEGCQVFENRGMEILIIALVVLVLFGSRRLPDAARSLGKSLRILKAETHALRTDAEPGAEVAQSPTAADPVMSALAEADPAAPTVPRESVKTPASQH